jgi:hypothetical protein
MITLTRKVVAENIQEGDEVDLDGDEYGDNEKAPSAYALVDSVTEWYADGYPWVTLHTDQGSYEMPAGHIVRLKVVE